MKKHTKYLIGIMSCCTLGTNLSAQVRDSDIETNVIRYNSPEDNIMIRAGGRVSFDAAHYINDVTDMGSGTQIGEARLNAFASFGGKYDVKIDLDFARGEVTFRDIFARWNINENSALRIGHYVMPFSLDRTASSVDRFFPTVSGTVNALTLDRRLGISYMLKNRNLWGEVGVFGGNVYKKYQGDDGWGTSIRLVANPIFDNGVLLHIGGGFSYRTPDPHGFTGGDDDYNRYFQYTANAETNVDRTAMLDAYIPWAHNEIRYNAELLISSGRFFIQSEYTGARVSRKRDNQRLFEDQLGGMWSFQTLEDWEDWYGKTLRSVSFNGVYAQIGVLLRGSAYTYNRYNALLAPCKEKGALELVARFNHTNLNDIDGIWYAGQFWDPEKGAGVDDPNFNHSIGGGIMNSATVGLNYYFNKYARVLVNYGYQHYNLLQKEDKYSHTIQGRLQISF